MTPRPAGGTPPPPAAAVHAHLDALAPVLASLTDQAGTLAHMGQTLARRLTRGARLLAAGNGGSAAEAQHLTSEIVGRFDRDRRPFAALALHAETSAVTAIGNDFGFNEVFARQVSAHARPGDVLVLLSTSGRSANLLRATRAAHERGAEAWALTGPGQTPLSRACDRCVALRGAPASVQEGHLIAIHALCLCFEAEVERIDARPAVASRGPWEAEGDIS